MTSADLKEYVTSTTDFYALLSLPPSFSQHELNRAWRRAALKYHPDKVGASDTVAAEKFHLAQIGFDIFQDPTIKTLYDNARNAREQKQRARKMFEGERKRMREDLEGREGRVAFGKGFAAGMGAGSGTKRSREEEDFEREVQRLAEDGKRRRQDREAILRQDLQVEQTTFTNSTGGLQTPHKTTTKSPLSHLPLVTAVAELDRSVKVRWLLASTSSATTINKKTLTTLFSRFGKIESVFLMKVKTQRIGPSREKQQVATGIVVFKSVVGAHTAIEDNKKQVEAEWEHIESVFWAGNKEPDVVAEMREGAFPTPQTPTGTGTNDCLNGDIPLGETPEPLETTGKRNGTQTPKGDGLRKIPSFGSFSSTAFSTPQGSPFGRVGSLSLEEITMIRLKEAEKRRLAAEITRKEEKDGY